MVYYVFLDTNIYEESNFSFGNGKFTKLKELAKSRRIILLYNEVVYGEIRQHIETNIKEAVGEYNSAIKNKGFAPFRSIGSWSEQLTLLDEKKLTECQWKAFDDYLEECEAIKIPTQNVNVDAILNNYFKRILPFENKKPNEFKDAISIEAVREYFEIIKENGFAEELYVVAADKGVRKSFRNDSGIFAFDNLNKFINYVILHTEHLALAVSKRFNKELFDVFIQDKIINEMNSAKFDAEDCYDGFTVEDIQYIEHKIGYINVIDTNIVEVMLEISTKICIDYLERDEKKSYYNEEEGSYILDAFTEYKEWHKVHFEAILVIDVEGIDEKTIKEKVEACNGLLEEFDESVLKITIGLEKIVIPKGTVISLNGGSFLERMVVRNILDGCEYTEYCRQCGEPLPYKNYESKGYCRNCAPSLW